MNFRTLYDDDIAGICQIYPPRDLSTSTCNPIRVYGSPRPRTLSRLG